MTDGKCPCCDAEMPTDAKVCPNCRIHVGKPDEEVTTNV